MPTDIRVGVTVEGVDTAATDDVGVGDWTAANAAACGDADAAWRPAGIT